MCVKSQKWVRLEIHTLMNKNKSANRMIAILVRNLSAKMMKKMQWSLS